MQQKAKELEEKLPFQQKELDEKYPIFSLINKSVQKCYNIPSVC